MKSAPAFDKIFRKIHSQSDGGVVKRFGGGAAPSKAPTPAPALSFITHLLYLIYQGNSFTTGLYKASLSENKAGTICIFL